MLPKSGKKPLKLAWLTNVPLPGAYEGNIPVICGWIRQLSRLLAKREDIELMVLYPQEKSRSPLRRKQDGIFHIGFYEPADPLLSYPEYLEQQFKELLTELKPDFIHIWGTEYVHALALMRAFGKPERVLVSIQGLVSVYADHYMAGVPEELQNKFTLRDFYHRDNLQEQQEKYRIRGRFEKELLAMTLHVAGRTSWDLYHTKTLAPNAEYHHCDEILREEFYDGTLWSRDKAIPHSIFASQFFYPIKGFHMLVQAMPKILKVFPNACIRVSGGGIIFPTGFKAKLRQTAYLKYL